MFVLFAQIFSLPPTLHFFPRGGKINFAITDLRERKNIIALHNNHNMSAPTALRQEQPEAQPRAVSYGEFPHLIKSHQS
jgi:hypothetical protein